MAITAKKLHQGALTSSLAAKVTGASAKITQVLQIWLANTGSSARTVQFTAYGTAAANTLLQSVALAASESKIIDCKIVLIASEVLYAKQDTGTDVTLTIYGLEEDV